MTHGFFKRRLDAAIPALFGVALFSLAIFVFFLPRAEQAILAQKKNMLSNLTLAAWNVANHNHSLELQGKLTRAQAQARAKGQIRAMRYGKGNSNYYWISNYNARLIMHPFFPALEGKLLAEQGKPHLAWICEQAAKAVEKQSMAFISYMWEKPKTVSEKSDKLTCVRRFEPWGWVIATGVFLNDIKAESQKMFRDRTIAALAIMVLVALLVIYLVIYGGYEDKQRDKAEKALRDTLDRNRAILEAAPDPMVVYDPNGKATYINPAFTRVFGWEPSEIIGKKIEFVPPENLEESMAVIRHVYDKGYGALETRRYNSDGEIIDVSISAANFRSADGSPAGMVVNLKDITNLKEIENSLRRSEHRYSTLFNSITDLIYTQDLQGRFLTLNSALASILGYGQKELIGRKASEFMPAVHAALFKTDYLDIVRSQGWQSGISTYIHRDGSKRFLEYSSNLVIPDQGGDPYISGMARDVTERIIAEKKLAALQDQLVQAHKMEALGTLAGGVAHDFNNILASILGYAELALDNLGPGHRVSPDLVQVLKGVSRAKDVVEQIFRFSRPSPHEQRPTKISVVVEEALELLRSSIPATISIKLSIEENESAVKADASQIHQLVMNLCTNASHSMSKTGGELTVSLSRVVLDLRQAEKIHEIGPGAYQRLEIADQGCGISKDDLNRIFEPFFSLREVGQGSGLGLAVVHGIVKSHSGAITVSSELGKGSSFVIYLPVMQSEKPLEPEESPKPPPISGGTESILLVDDEEVLVEMTAKALGVQGYKVTGLSSSQEAWELFQKRPDDFNLVITDFTMPGLTGADLAERIHRLKPETPIILCTGYSNRFYRHDENTSHISRILAKPVSFRDLTMHVREALDQSRA